MALDERLKKESSNKKGLDSKLYEALVPNGQGWLNPVLDPYKADFFTVLKELPQGRKDALARTLRIRHGVPLTFNNFVRALEQLREKRHYLEHSDEKKPDGFSETQVLEALGLLLLPALHQQFLGALNAAACRLEKCGQVCPRGELAAARHLLAEKAEERKEETRRLYGEHISKLSRSDRQDYHESLIAWNRKYDAFYPPGCWPRYNLHNFRIRHAFIGKPRLHLIEKALRDSLPESRRAAWQPHFSRDIEPLFLLAMKVNRLTDYFCQTLKQCDAEVLSKKQRQRRGAMAVENMGAIRNSAAHGGLFWTIRDKSGELLSPSAYFGALFAAALKPHVPHSTELKSQIFSRFRDLLQEQEYVWVQPRDLSAEHQTPPVHVKRWTKTVRQRYANRDKWQVDRRIALRQFALVWRQALVAENRKKFDTDDENG
ncbi:MAG: hypothetical protein MRY59_09910 [Aquisalinus sp.]|nr:hypothetical protein [Aquisalinus sp.]